MNTRDWSPDTLRAIHEDKVRRMTPAQRARSEAPVYGPWPWPLLLYGVYGGMAEPQGHDPYNHIGQHVRDAKGWPPVMCVPTFHNLASQRYGRAVRYRK